MSDEDEMEEMVEMDEMLEFERMQADFNRNLGLDDVSIPVTTFSNCHIRTFAINSILQSGVKLFC